MRSRAVIQLVLVLTIAITPCLAACGKDVRKMSAAGSRKAVVSTGIASLPMAAPRFKSGDQPWVLGPALPDEVHAPGLPALGLAATAALGPPAALRIFGRSPVGSRPPPRL